jgi:hypothetical protein
MRLMQHMLPGLLTNVGNVPVQFADARPAVPEGALQKNLAIAITSAVGAIVDPIATIITTPDNNRTAQELAQQATLQAQIGAETAAQARAANMAMLKYAAGAALVALTLYLLLR